MIDAIENDDIAVKECRIMNDITCGHTLGYLFCAFLACCAALFVPATSEGAIDNFYYQYVTPSPVCGGLSTGSQTGDANVPATGTVQYYYAPDTSADSFSHMSALDMYTAPYTSPMTITKLWVLPNATYTHSLYLQALHLVYARFYDVDGNTPCPPSEKGTLIAQTPISTWYDILGQINPGIYVDGLLYNMLPGHRIRVELWNQKTGGTLLVTYGPGTNTRLAVTETPTVTDTCTVGPGTALPDVAVNAGEQELPIDAFTLQASAGTDRIQELAVTLAPGTWNVVGKVTVKSDDGAITYGSASNPDYDVVRIPLTTAITATTTPVQYKIWVTPRMIEEMPLPEGGTHPVTATVTQLDSAYTKIYNDTTSATVTITNQGGNGTVTIGNGTDPANSTVGYSSSQSVDLDIFTLRSTRTTTVTGLTVSLAPGTAPAINQIVIKGGTVGASDYNTTYGYLNFPASDTVTVTGLNIPVASTPVTLRVVLWTRQSPPVQMNYVVTGTVTGVTASIAPDTVAADDSGSATVTIDNLPAAPPVPGQMTPQDRRVKLCWTNPADPDFAGTLILLNTAPITDVPYRGSTYSDYVYGGNHTIGTSTVAFSQPGTAGGSQCGYVYSLTNNTPYYFNIFSRDSRNNYSSGVGVGPLMPQPMVTVGAVSPYNDVVGPGYIGILDTFTISASSSGASVNSVTVSLSPGAREKLLGLRIYGNATYSTVVAPTEDTVTIPTPAIAIPPDGSVTFRIEGFVKPEADMSPPPGEQTTIFGRVTAITTTSPAYIVFNYASTSTVTIDNLSPGDPAGISAIPLDRGFSINWTNPADADFSSVLVLRNTGAVTGRPAEGAVYTGGSIGGSIIAYVGNARTFIDSGLANGTAYHYRFFARDIHGNYSMGADFGPVTPQPSNRTVTGTPTAVMQGRDAIAVTMPFTDDANGNGSCSVVYKLSSAAPTDWTWFNGTSRSAGSCNATITGLTVGSPYDLQVGYIDPDGILGTISYSFTGLVSLESLQTSVGTASAAFIDSSSTMRVTAPFADDYNHNNSCLIEYKKSIDATWTTWGVPGPPGGPFELLLQLSQLASYDVRVTFTDPDGVNGTAVQTITGVIAPSVKNPKLIHNSLNANRKGYWAQYGGWGIPGGQYGEFTCLTCHTKRTTNASRIRTDIMLSPLPGSSNFGGPVRFDGPTGPYSFGDDSVARPVPPPVNRICEVCHTLTTSTNSGPIHRNILTVTPNHAASNGKDCTRCHKHENGFSR